MRLHKKLHKKIKAIHKRIRRGEVSLLLVFVMIPVILVLWLLASSLPKFGPPSGEEFKKFSQYCRPEVEKHSANTYTFLPDSPAIKAPTYSTSDVRNIAPGTDNVWYKRIKTNVPILAEVFSGSRDCDETRENCQETIAKHFQAYPGEAGIRTVDDKRYRIYFPTGEAGELLSNKFNTPTGDYRMDFKANRLLFLVHLEDTGNLAKMDEIATCIHKTNDPNNPIESAFGDLVGKNNATKMWYVDVYQEAVPTTDGKASATPVTYLPEDVLVCYDNTDIICPIPTQDVPSVTISDNQTDNKQLQLKTFPISDQRAAFASWYTPACKPAIYLYPETTLPVHVSVNTKGFLTYTDPLYPEGVGWDVVANPTGDIILGAKKYDYLYYESKIPEDLVEKPKEGYVISYEKLSSLYDSLLPKLGLSDKQTKDFSEYWEKALPKSPYYFVGVMTEKSIDAIEPLTIIPPPATIIRVRLYFEALVEPISVLEPKIKTPVQKGFTVVEWGGMVKTDKNSPFICSQ